MSDIEQHCVSLIIKRIVGCDDDKAIEAAAMIDRYYTAPGATTKSDGGAKAGSSPILASKEDQRTRAHGVMPVGDNADASGCTGTGPSDPSSTRSDVTVEALRYAESTFDQIRLTLINHFNEPVRSAFWQAVEGREVCKATLLKTHQIRRK